MPETWHSLYLPAGDPPAITAALLDALHQLGYQRYDPFAGGTGTPPGLKTFVKHFIAPPVDGWARILGEPDLQAVIDLSKGRMVLHAWLTDADGNVSLYQDGQARDEALTTLLRPGKTADDLRRAQAGTAPVAADPLNSTVPAEMQHLAHTHNVNPEQANQMIERITSRLFGKLDRASDGEASDMRARASALATGANRLNWNSAAGQRLKALAAVLGLPSNWREPDFEMVRAAYQAARYLRKSPNARLMPDEQEALKALPHAIQYEAVYAGK
jgi:hypothetical protein